AAALDELNKLQRRALARILDVLLVREPDDQNARTAEAAPAPPVERLDEPFDDVVRHGGVDLAGKLDEACDDVVLARLPGEIERIDRNAVAAETGARIERHIAERL